MPPKAATGFGSSKRSTPSSTLSKAATLNARKTARAAIVDGSMTLNQARATLSKAKSSGPGTSRYGLYYPKIGKLLGAYGGKTDPAKIEFVTNYIIGMKEVPAISNDPLIVPKEVKALIAGKGREYEVIKKEKEKDERSRVAVQQLAQVGAIDEATIVGSLAKTMLSRMAASRQIDREILEPWSDVFAQWPDGGRRGYPYETQICYIGLTQPNWCGFRAKELEPRVKYRTDRKDHRLLIAGLRQSRLISEARLAQFSAFMVNFSVFMTGKSDICCVGTVEHVGPVASKLPSTIGVISGLFPAVFKLSPAYQRLRTAEYAIATCYTNMTKSDELQISLRGGSSNLWPIFANNRKISDLATAVYNGERKGDTPSRVWIQQDGQEKIGKINDIQAQLYLLAMFEGITEEAMAARWKPLAEASMRRVFGEFCNALRAIELLANPTVVGHLGEVPADTRLTDILRQLLANPNPAGIVAGNPEFRASQVVTEAQFELDPEGAYNSLSPTNKRLFKSLPGRLFNQYSAVLVAGGLPDLQTRIVNASRNPIEHRFPRLDTILEKTGDVALAELLTGIDDTTRDQNPLPAGVADVARVVKAAESEVKAIFRELPTEERPEGIPEVLIAEPIPLPPPIPGSSLERQIERIDKIKEIKGILDRPNFSIIESRDGRYTITRNNTPVLPPIANNVEAASILNVLLEAPETLDSIQARFATRAANAAQGPVVATGGYQSKKPTCSKRNGTKQSKRMGRILSCKLRRGHLHRSHRRPRPSSPTAQRRTQRRSKSNK